MAFTGIQYKAPAEGDKSSVDTANSDQMNTFYWLKKALIDAKKDEYFMQMAPVKNMPKHYGKTMKLYHWVPLLDDRNVNDQGIDAQGATIANGNLYGSSRDIGTITSKLPALGENGGRVNRVGFSRIELEGSIANYGVFYEFTRDSLDFDSEDNLKEHFSRELINGMSQMTEAMLQIDLLNSAGTVVYPGSALQDSDIDETCELTYKDLMDLSDTLTDNRTPMQTTVITGSRYIDTRTIPACRVAYVGIDLMPTLRAMKDQFGNPAFIPVQHYADAATALRGEVGSIGHFRIIMVPEMLHWAGAGKKAADSGENAGKFKTTNVGGEDKLNVYPFLVVGDESFATIGYQTDGKSVKFDIMTKMPGRETMDRDDPYGKTGLSSLQFWYGMLTLRPERIGLIKTVAQI